MKTYEDCKNEVIRFCKVRNKLTEEKKAYQLGVKNFVENYTFED